MASLAREGKGWRILFVDPAGTRKTIRLGRVDKKGAESIRVHVENLLGSPNGRPAHADGSGPLTLPPG